MDDDRTMGTRTVCRASPSVLYLVWYFYCRTFAPFSLVIPRRRSVHVEQMSNVFALKVIGSELVLRTTLHVQYVKKLGGQVEKK